MADETRETRERAYEEEEAPQDAEETAQHEAPTREDDGAEWHDDE